VDSPAFGQADLTNCERELIHLAGSVQPHGALLVMRERDLRVVQCSANADAMLGCPGPWLLERGIAELGGDLAAQIRALLAGPLGEPALLQCHVVARGGSVQTLEGALHRQPSGALVLELEAVDPPAMGAPTAQCLPAAILSERLQAGVQRITAAASLGTLADTMVQVFRDLTGYDRVMVYKFDPDGHGKIIAEARDPRLDSLLGHHYPSTDIPQRARELYLKNRVRLLVDVNYEPQPLVPELLPLTGQPLDMSLCDLRSMSPLHLQYLKNMGVTGTVVASLVREGKLWGLLAAHHYSPRHLRRAMRSAVDLLAEVASTRISAIENYAHAQVALLVRRLEQRLIEATSTEGDWRLALFRNPRTLLQPLEATGAALFHDGEILTSGEVPSTPELRALRDWVDAQDGELPFACSSVGQADAALQSLTPTAAGVLAVKLSTSRPDYLMWFRKEQLLSVTWAGNPAKPLVDNDPMTLSPRRSFDAWSEIVRGTAVPWSNAERVMARAVGTALVDIIVQVHAVRLLIAEHQLGQIRATLGSSREPVLVVDPAGRVMFANDAFAALMGEGAPPPAPGDAVAALFEPGQAVGKVLDRLSLQPWRGEWGLVQAGRPVLPVAVRAEAVPGRDGGLLGFILTLTDLSDVRRAAEARRHLEAALQVSAQGPRTSDGVLGAILTNASLAAMDIADSAGGPTVAPLLEELEVSARRATALYAQIRQFSA
jgi:light-regulated signal transduction histidine kinase (bacteriophytochrome)